MRLRITKYIVYHMEGSETTVLILLVIVAFIYFYAMGDMGGVPGLIKTLSDDDYVKKDINCDKQKKEILLLLKYKPGYDIIIDLLFEHVFTKKDSEEVIKILEIKCPLDHYTDPNLDLDGGTYRPYNNANGEPCELFLDNVNCRPDYEQGRDLIGRNQLWRQNSSRNGIQTCGPDDRLGELVACPLAPIVTFPAKTEWHLSDISIEVSRLATSVTITIKNIGEERNDNVIPVDLDVNRIYLHIWADGATPQMAYCRKELDVYTDPDKGKKFVPSNLTCTGSFVVNDMIDDAQGGKFLPIFVNPVSCADLNVVYRTSTANLGNGSFPISIGALNPRQSYTITAHKVKISETLGNMDKLMKGYLYSDIEPTFDGIGTQTFIKVPPWIPPNVNNSCNTCNTADVNNEWIDAGVDATLTCPVHTGTNEPFDPNHRCVPIDAGTHELSGFSGDNGAYCTVNAHCVDEPPFTNSCINPNATPPSSGFFGNEYDVHIGRCWRSDKTWPFPDPDLVEMDTSNLSTTAPRIGRFELHTTCLKIASGPQDLMQTNKFNLKITDPVMQGFVFGCDGVIGFKLRKATPSWFPGFDELWEPWVALDSSAVMDTQDGDGLTSSNLYDFDFDTMYSIIMTMTIESEVNESDALEFQILSDSVLNNLPHPFNTYNRFDVGSSGSYADESAYNSRNETYYMPDILINPTPSIYWVELDLINILTDLEDNNIPSGYELCPLINPTIKIYSIELGLGLGVPRGYETIIPQTFREYSVSLSEMEGKVRMLLDWNKMYLCIFAVTLQKVGPAEGIENFLINKEIADMLVLTPEDSTGNKIVYESDLNNGLRCNYTWENIYENTIPYTWEHST